MNHGSAVPLPVNPKHDLVAPMRDRPTRKGAAFTLELDEALEPALDVGTGSESEHHAGRCLGLAPQGVADQACHSSGRCSASRRESEHAIGTLATNDTLRELTSLEMIGRQEGAA